MQIDNVHIIAILPAVPLEKHAPFHYQSFRNRALQTTNPAQA
jgi:hypothetical protein